MPTPAVAEAGAPANPARPRRDRRLLLAGLLLLAVPIVAGLLLRGEVGHSVFQPLDDRWLTFVTGPREGGQLALALLLNGYARPDGFIVKLAVVLLLLLVWRRPWSAAFFLTGGLVASLISQLFKNLVDRPRPPGTLVIVDHGSFTSGHVIAAAVTVVMIAALLRPAARRWWWPVGVVLITAMAWSRTYLYAHWLTDTLAGAFIGAAVALTWWWLWQPLLRRERPAGPPAR